MRLLVSTILIFFVLLGQAIIAAPHVHLESVEYDAKCHAAKAHIHLHSSRDHSHEYHHGHDIQPPVPSSDQHDDDAVYVTETDFTNANHSTSLPELVVSFAVIPSIHVHSTEIHGSTLAGSWDIFGDTVRPQCALYAQLLSIRC